MSQTRYKLGPASIVELSQAQLQQTQAQIGSAQATYQYRLALAVFRSPISDPVPRLVVCGRGFAPVHARVEDPGAYTIGTRKQAEAARRPGTDISCHFRYARQGRGAGVSYASCI